MRKDEWEQFAEKWIDEALKNYYAEPSLGLETRIVANIRAQQQPAHWFFARPWQVAAAVAFAALLAVGVAAWQQGRSGHKATPGPAYGAASAPAQQNMAAPPSESAETKVISPVRHRTRRQASVGKKKPAQVPRREQFPAPVPLSAAEERLLAYVRNTPKTEVVLVARAQEERQKSAEREAQKIYLEGMK